TGVANNAAATLTRAGNHALTLTTTATTALTLPATGTLATLAGTETLSGKTLTSPVVNGLMTGTAVTQSSTDATAGRVLKHADWGVGAAFGPTAPNPNTTLRNGWYTFSSGATGVPVPATGSLLVAGTSALVKQQIAFFSGSDTNRAFVRGTTDGG